MAEKLTKAAEVPFDQIRRELVGGVPREHVEAIRSAATFLIKRFGAAKCDSEAVSECVRCSAHFLAQSALEALAGAKTVSEMSREIAGHLALQEQNNGR